MGTFHSASTLVAQSVGMSAVRFGETKKSRDRLLI